ncbi:MAG: CehA/McbA family metallohydrolase [Verrucomicrobiaceae bacterium]|nr:CehA/McbA family metallohydrolase [Verrucomicrobiaceae bacterium]
MKLKILRCLWLSSLIVANLNGADVEPQPFLAALRRIIDATDYLGTPFSDAEKAALARCISRHEAESVDVACGILDGHALFHVNINPEQRVKVAQGKVKPELDEGGWRQFLVRVQNDAGVTAKLAASSPFAKVVYVPGSPPVEPNVKPKDPGQPALEARWLDLQMFDDQPMKPALSGLALEYRIIQLYSRDAGKREAAFSFDTGQGTQDIGFRNEVSILFDCRPAHVVKLAIKDEHGAPCTASLLIRDKARRVYPSQFKRLAPDFFFHPQVYRADGEAMKLPAGEYEVTFQRGPESLREVRTLSSEMKEWSFQVRRWIDPSKFGWWSGDHHIHAAGCAHYSVPSMGVHAPDMARHCQGEDLKIGANLTWGPCFDYQKQFFTGAEDKESRYPFLLRYDVEVSGFGSHRSGHLCLLKLKEQMYPGGDSTAHWPTLCLNTLKWAKKQGALCGPAHSGWGLQPLPENDPARDKPYNLKTTSATDELPNYIVPPYNGIGANEYIVDVAHEVEGPDGRAVPAVDFLSTVDTPAPWELNMWYHTLNAGFRTRISGETDFPCIYGERVGLGRAYVKLDGRLTYDAWCEAIREGRCYVSDGRSHLMEFRANDVALGENGSELRLDAPGRVTLTAKVAALLEEAPDPAMKGRPFNQKPFWDIERARIGGTRSVPVEALVNGVSVAKKNLVADGRTEDLRLEVQIKRSSWVALRILASSHTNPVFVIVGGKPVREKRSIEWCRKGVDQCWSQKESLIDPKEHADALAAYGHARQVYDQRLKEAGVD